MSGKKKVKARTPAPESIEEEKKAPAQPEVLDLTKDSDQGIAVINAVRQYVAS